MSITSTQKSYDIVPVNNKCSQVINHSVIVESPNTTSAKTSGTIDSLENQQKESTRFDTIDGVNVSPLSGGKKKLKKFLILFSNKKYINYGLNENESIKLFINNRIFKKDNLLEIIYNNKSSLYIIKGFNKNKFIKIY